MESIENEKRECVKFIRWYQKVMYQRYGIDELYVFLFKVLTLVVIFNLFLSKNSLFLVEVLLLLIMCFRKYSKNIEARRRENRKYLSVRKRLMEKKSPRDRDHIYKKCRNCKTILRLPLPATRGIKQARCPSCQKKLKVLCLKKQQIEVIRKGVKIKV